MPKSRYDEDENKSRHAAADEDCCDEMADKYGWQLVDVEKRDIVKSGVWQKSSGVLLCKGSLPPARWPCLSDLR